MSSNRLVKAVEGLDAFLRRLGRSYVLVVIVALVVGLLLAPAVFFGAPTASEPGQIAVVPVAGAIDGSNERQIGAQLARAKADDDIEAVVLVMNSGGGTAAASEELYMQIERTSREMPVVTAIDAGALSGAYYAAAPSDEIFAKPASAVGSVGVIVAAPQRLEPNDVVLTTGPAKTGPDDQREFVYQRAELTNAFANAVLEHREDEMAITRSELTEANVYTGTAANENGLIDNIGGRERATARAAEIAGLDEYAVTVLQPDGTVRFIAQANYVAADTPEKELVSPSYLTGHGTPASSAANTLAIPAEYAIPADTTADSEASNEETTAGEATDSAEGETDE